MTDNFKRVVAVTVIIALIIVSVALLRVVVRGDTALAQDTLGAYCTNMEADFYSDVEVAEQLDQTVAAVEEDPILYDMELTNLQVLVKNSLDEYGEREGVNDDEDTYLYWQWMRFAIMDDLFVAERQNEDGIELVGAITWYADKAMEYQLDPACLEGSDTDA